VYTWGDPHPLCHAAPRQEPTLNTIERAVTDIAAGRPVVVVDDPSRENEGDLVFAACHATPALVGFTVRYTSGLICVPMEASDLDRLKLPPMVAVNQDPKGTAYAVSVDGRDAAITTGISAHDRACTSRMLADAATTPEQLSRPGHLFPLRAVPGGVLRRRGHTEAAVDLARLAGLPPVGVIAELVADDGSLLRLPQLTAFARRHRLAVVSVADLIAYRTRREAQVERVAEARLPTRHGEFTVYGYRGTLDGVEHLALVHGDLGGGDDVLVRLHSECLTGDVVGSLRCDCGLQLTAAMAAVAEEGRGVVVYLRGHEGRGIGLLQKLRAYQLQQAGHDTVDANLALGLPADARNYATGAQMLADLGVRSLRLLTNNPAKQAALAEHGLQVLARLPVVVPPNINNYRYLRTKRDRMGHDIGGLESGMARRRAR
jgi:3,4-dihydroxy 2-butanone 4-phosphate synthase/GTP cyclohydrolase II